MATNENIMPTALEDPQHSTDQIWYKDNMDLSLSTKLDNIESNVAGKAPTGHTHTGYADADHTHTGYADEGHTHTPASIGAAPASHSHTGYANADHTHTGFADASHGHEQSDIEGLITALAAKAEATHDHTLAQVVGLVAALAAKADLVDGKVPASQLPSYVDDVIEGHLHNATTFYENIADDVSDTVEVVPESGKVYLDINTNKSYRWSGTSYVEIPASLALGETSATAYRGDHGKTAYDHSQNADVHVTAAQKTAWDGKAAGDHTHTPASLGAAPESHGHSYSDVTNPPMLFGVEYLTNEKWNGEPLYTVLLDCGTFADGTIFDSNIACRYVVRYGGRIGWSAVPLIHYTLENAFTSWVEVSNHNGHIRVIMQGGASVGNPPVHIQVWYTKATN